MGEGYATAIRCSQEQRQTFTEADAVVKGQDRAPTDALDKLALRLQAVLEEIRQARSRPASRRASAARADRAAAFAAVVGWWSS
jgi:hypothetical protein